MLLTANFRLPFTDLIQRDFFLVKDTYEIRGNLRALEPVITLLNGENGFVTATKLGTSKYFVAATKDFAAATKRFVDRTKHFVVTKYFCHPYFHK